MVDFAGGAAAGSAGAATGGVDVAGGDGMAVVAIGEADGSVVDVGVRVGLGVFVSTTVGVPLGA